MLTNAYNHSQRLDYLEYIFSELKKDSRVQDLIIEIQGQTLHNLGVELGRNPTPKRKNPLKSRIIKFQPR